MIQFSALTPDFQLYDLGFLPEMLSINDGRRAREQFDSNYAHGGGWSPMIDFTLNADNSLSYPGDPPMHPLAQAQLRMETILFYPHAWVAVIQPDRTFEVSRMD